VEQRGCNPPQLSAKASRLNPANYLRTVADGRHQLRPHLHGKEGVDGSSPSEGFCKVPARRPISHSERLADIADGVGMEPIMELSRFEPSDWEIHEAVTLPNPTVTLYLPVDIFDSDVFPR
jgi:hypothetical protein